MSFTRKVSLITGVAFIITFVASIPAAFYFYSPVLNNADYILGAGADARIGWGAFLEVILVVANVATAVALFPSSSGRTKASRSATWPRAPSSRR